MVTIADIARVCGVSKMTVSNVLNGRDDKVSATTKQRVLGAAAELQYQPSAAARSLSVSRSEIISLVYYAAADGDLGLSNPHDAMLLGEIERHLSAAGKHLMIHAATDASDTARRLRSWNVDGALFLGVLADEVEQLRRHQDVPMVFIDAYTDVEISTVGLDDAHGSYDATRHLLSAGHRSIAFVGPGATSAGVINARFTGFSRALTEAQIDVDDMRVLTNLTFADAEAAAAKLLASPQRFTAAVVTADILAIGLIKAFARRGIRVPDDFSLVGFDDLPIADMVTPSLTTVRQDIAEKARVAVDLLMEQLDGQSAPRRIILEPTLVQRESVAGPRSPIT
ncbi:MULTISPECIES: LacI family DNA-binding transcriptional regulator [unclassified Microbacterium]|uniref:LacI family DNA-binding transcriptional regulator n=1 Tax=unclassified Microbacterium TaxID=2609290 RepID=UPI0016043CE3|nr:MULTISPECIES: LacI family DNA-binding transcriptional regulator [unclassified Microbacterium]MBT2484704.1 LacI family DNA-binding transcriptional regulator [Microbacterium sp. ISL-108]